MKEKNTFKFFSIVLKTNARFIICCHLKNHIDFIVRHSIIKIRSRSRHPNGKSVIVCLYVPSLHMLCRKIIYMNEITYFVTLITTLLNEIILTYNRRTSLLAKTLPRHGKTCGRKQDDFKYN